ncbi:SRPBCC family protein [Pseudarthrobacter albicanus]|uniref:SRPBCC family protein n=1 Tax=Pseudarthrobacter albicanus TaxID=2823873 RepID=UPI001BAA2715|nr:SRPBCC domain-containing protein [Pseudarthrobacter albicanus]
MNEQETGLTLELSPAFSAPRERIFAMLTDPAELAKWWGPRGFGLPAAELELRAGGRYRFTMKPPDGEPFHLSGAFLEIGPPGRLVYTFNWDEPAPDDTETVVTLMLHAHDGGTRVSLSQGLFATEERLALHRNGWTESFEKLREVLTARG